MESVIDIIIESSFIDVHDIRGDWGGVFVSSISFADRWSMDYSHLAPKKKDGGFC